LKIISVVIPALNEQESIEKVIAAIPKDKLSNMGFECQILIVDNGSDDDTGSLARTAGADVVLEPQRGYGKAYKTGFANASGEIIATADADCTYPVEDIPKIVNILEDENLDFITTNRFAFQEKGAMSVKHRLGNNILSLALRMLFRLNIKDSQSGMWIFRKSLLDKMVLRADTMALSQELKIEACHFATNRWKEIPIEYRTRVGEVKLRSWRDGMGNLLQLINKRFSR
jgi:glycosyltransferase involved in cell wall biosynthesis